MNLSIENIKKSYQEKMAVDDISFEINRGETVGILGPNGAGKTTLFYIIVGLIRCDAGKLSLSGKELKNKSISERTSMGLSYLPQESSIFRGLSVEQNIFAALEQRKDLNQEEKILKLSELLEEFNLKEFSKTLGIKLSGGERRRTEIARSLASNPKFILLDEPFAGIDPIAVSDLKNTFRSLNKKNIGDMMSLDIAFPRNEKKWLEVLPKSIDDQIEYKFYYGHLFCHVLHQNYIIKKGVDPKKLKEKLFKTYDNRGAEYPSEHNVGHEYEAKDSLKNFYKSLDPTNTFNPGIGLTSKLKNWE